MPVPSEYQRATDQMMDFLGDVRDMAFFGSRHQAYTMTQGVFQTFRRRLSIPDAIRFAQVLPAGLRALFVAAWDPNEPTRGFESREAMTEEVRSLRSEHNYSTDDAILVVATALRRHVDEAAFDAVLVKLPAGAQDFWRPDGRPASASP